MKSEDISKQIKSIQIKAGKDLGFPLASEFWGELDDYIGYTPEDYDGDPDGAQEYIVEYEGVTNRYIRVVKMTLPSLTAKLRTKPSPSAAKSGKSPKVKKTYPGPFERRLHLFDFVMQRKGGITARANWKQIAAEWNEEHPHNPQTWRNMKSRFYELKRDDVLTESWLAWRIGPVVIKRLRRVISHWEARTLGDLAEIEEIVEREISEKGGKAAIDELNSMIQKKWRQKCEAV